MPLYENDPAQCSSSTITSFISIFQAHVGGAFREDLRSSLSPSTDHNCQMQSTHQQATQTACKYFSCEKYSGLPGYVILIMLFLLSIVLIMLMSILTPKRGKMDKICKVKSLNLSFCPNRLHSTHISFEFDVLSLLNP